MTLRHLGFTLHETARSIIGAAAVAYMLFILGVLLAIHSCAYAHDSWISKGNHRNPAGELCCGDYDCGVMVMGEAKAVAGGYEIDGIFRIIYDGDVTDEHVREFWPYQEVMPSPDGATWRCKRADGSPRCRFIGPPGS